MILKKNTNRGLVKTIIIFFFILLILAYFGLNIREIIASETFRDNWQFVKDSAVWIWEKILKTPIIFIWESIFIPLIWNPITENIKYK